MNAARGLLLGGLLVLAACGRAATPVVVVSCPSGTCWDGSEGAIVAVNDLPSEASLGQDDAHAWRVATVPGRSYIVLTRVFSGSADTYVAFAPVFDPVADALFDPRSERGLSFTATGRTAFIVVADRGNDAGTDYSVRVASYDEALDPLPGTTALAVNAAPLLQTLASGQTARYVFDASSGVDYTIRVVVTNGAVEAFASLIPSVDDDLYDLGDDNADGLLPFRATETGRYYVAVINRSGAADAEFGIQISSP